MLKDLRTKAGLTQAELSELTGVKQTTISRLESGNRKGKYQTWILLQRALGFSDEMLLRLIGGQTVENREKTNTSNKTRV